MALFVLLEVMDKEPSIGVVWLTFLLIGAVGAILASRWRSTVVLSLAVFGSLAWGHHSELTDPFVGSAIVEEAGSAYVWQSYSAMGIGLGILLAGLRSTKRRSDGKSRIVR